MTAMNIDETTTTMEKPKVGTARVRPGLMVIDPEDAGAGGIITGVYPSNGDEFVVWVNSAGRYDYQAVKDIIVPDAGTTLDLIADDLADLLKAKGVAISPYEIPVE